MENFGPRRARCRVARAPRRIRRLHNVDGGRGRIGLRRAVTLPGDVGLELLEMPWPSGRASSSSSTSSHQCRGRTSIPSSRWSTPGSARVRGFAHSSTCHSNFSGCIAGTIVANLMFGHSWVSWSTHHRASAPHFLSEIVATAGLIFLVFALQRQWPKGPECGRGRSVHIRGVLRDLVGHVRQSGRHRGARVFE